MHTEQQVPASAGAAGGLSASALQTAEETYLLHRRFDRMGRLVGDTGMARLMSSHVMVVGLGGVGSWVGESLARSGVGRLSLVDFDAVCVTNTNRQLQAMHGSVGRKKAAVLAERIQKINPRCQVEGIEQFYNESSSDELLGRGPHFVIDAIDNISAKCHLLATCRQRGIPVLTSGGAGGRLDPLQVTATDLANSQNDPMLLEVRRILRKKYDFPATGPMGIDCVWSREPYRMPEELHYDLGKGFRCVCPMGKNDLHSCEKRAVIYGNASFVTGTFGFALSSLVVRKITS